ncbi:DUF2878 domain-containing protein [Dyella jejuensis]|uniref:DUF2878 domain-containing protein n=1 Tax=Dyella jejuensis TaxID=1432009 RepID=A0ABW8JLK5_9GAMM
MSFWGNLIGYQLVWFAAVIGAARGAAWPGLISGLLFISWQTVTAKRPEVELRLLAIALLLGIVIDGVMAQRGWARYATSSPAFPEHGAPWWILALWMSFATTLNRSLAYLRDRPWLALALGAIGAPLAYLGAQRGWHAVVFAAPAWRGIGWIAASWALALPLLAWLARRLGAASRPSIASISPDQP